jgi:hypothetical protein
MQTFFNPTTPFLDDEGRPMVGAMVSFLDTETNASLIDITDSDGVALPNPLYTGSDGRIRLDNGNGAPAVPCVADGLTYKVVVARRTGVEPVYVGGILQNGSELYEEPYIAFVVTASGAAGGSNSTVVGSIAEVRLAEPELGSVVCSGYYSAGDCPSRVYSWVKSQNPPADNAVNILRNSDHSTGYWKMAEPDGGLWDVRIAGMQTSNTPAVNDQCLTRLLNIINGSTTAVATLYFPRGEWLLDSGFVCGSLCLEKEANLKPADNSNNRTVTVAFLENRGGHFCATTENDTTAKRVLPVLTSLLRTSWLKGTVAEFLTSAVLANLTEVDFDVVTYGGSASVTIQKKIIHNSQNRPVSVGTGNCILFDYTDGELYISHLRLGRFLITLNQGDIQYILTQSNTSMLDVHTQGISTPKIQVSGGGSFGTGISVTGNSSFLGSLTSDANITAQIISAQNYFVGLLKGTVEGHLKPFLIIDVTLQGDGSAGSEIVGSAIDIQEDEIFLLRVTINLAQFTTDSPHQYTKKYPITGTNKYLVVANDDIVQRVGTTLAVGCRKGNDFFFTYNRDGNLFSASYGIYART